MTVIVMTLYDDVSSNITISGVQFELNMTVQ